MTAKEFVKQHMPTAAAERHVRGRVKGMQETYWLIRERGQHMYYASGSTESKAWKEAKEQIEYKLKQVTS